MNTVSKIPLLSQFQVTKSEYDSYHRCNYSVYPRPFSSIVLLLKGRSEFCCNGISFNIAEGESVLIPAGTKYVSNWTGEPQIAYLCIHFNFENRYSDYSPQNFALQKLNLTSGVMKKNLDFLLSHIQKNGYEPLCAMSSFYSFYSKILKTLKPGTIYGQTWNQVKCAVEYLENNVCENPTVGDLAKLCMLSESRFYELFSKTLNCSPMIYKNNIKIRHAMSMLGGDYTITAITEKLGFSSEQYFRKTFKQFTGKTPAAYRKGLLCT